MLKRWYCNGEISSLYFLWYCWHCCRRLLLLLWWWWCCCGSEKTSCDLLHQWINGDHTDQHQHTPSLPGRFYLSEDEDATAAGRVQLQFVNFWKAREFSMPFLVRLKITYRFPGVGKCPIFSHHLTKMGIFMDISSPDFWRCPKVSKIPQKLVPMFFPPRGFLIIQWGKSRSTSSSPRLSRR